MLIQRCHKIQDVLFMRRSGTTCWYSVCLLLLAFADNAFAKGLTELQSFLEEPTILPVAEAFKLSAQERAGVINLYWEIKPGYYLYKHRFSVSANTALATPEIKPGILKHDEYFGDVEVFYVEMDVDIAISGEVPKQLQVTVGFQGCADVGVCYPPQKRALNL